MTKTEKSTTQKAEEIARRMAREVGQPESMWELFLSKTYDELFQLNGKVSNE